MHFVKSGGSGTVAVVAAAVWLPAWEIAVIFIQWSNVSRLIV